MANVQIKTEKLTPFGGIFQSWSNLTPCFHLLSTGHLVRDAEMSQGRVNDINTKRYNITI